MASCNQVAVALVVLVCSAYSESSDTKALSSSPYKSESAAIPKGKQICEFGVTSCPANQQCVSKNSRSKSGTCECLNDYELSDDGECLRRTEKEKPVQVQADKATCEFGVDLCGTNEVCKPRNNRSKVGLCVCSDGYQRNQDKVCEAINSTLTVKVTTEVQTTLKPNTSPPPKPADVQLAAIAGPDIVVSTPETLVVIEGGAKSRGNIVKYSWRVAESSPATGRILNGSEHHRTLLFVPFTTGTYEFTLTVLDENGSTAHDSVRVTVNDAVGRYAVAMRLSSGAYRFSFSEADRRALETQIELLLTKPSASANLRAEVTIDSLKEQHFDSSKTVEFNVRFVPLENDSPLASVSHNHMLTDVANDSGMPPFRVGDPNWVSDYLEEKLEEQRGRLLDFDILNVDPKYCVDPLSIGPFKNTTKRTRCGFHASCVDDRKCVCDTFWLANPMHRLRAHCDVNLFALTLVPAVVLLALLALIAFCIRRCCSPRRSLHDRVRERLEQRERESREAKRRVANGAKTRARNAKAILDNAFDSDDNYGAETDDDSTKLHSGSSLNKLTEAHDHDHDELHDAELTAFVCDNVNVRSMNVNTEKSSSKIKA